MRAFIICPFGGLGTVTVVVIDVKDSNPLRTMVAAPPPGSSSASASKEPSVRKQARQAKQRQREERHRRVREMREQGHSIRQSARLVRCSVKAVKRYLREEKCPDWNTGRQPGTQLDEYAEVVGEWIAQGGRNSAELFRLLIAKGCRASYDACVVT